MRYFIYHMAHAWKPTYPSSSVESLLMMRRVQHHFYTTTVRHKGMKAKTLQLLILLLFLTWIELKEKGGNIFPVSQGYQQIAQDKSNDGDNTASSGVTLTWMDSVCSEKASMEANEGATGIAKTVSVDEVFHPLDFDAPIDTLQTKVRIHGTNVSLLNAWFELESVMANGTETSSLGGICNSNLTQLKDHPFILSDQQMWYSRSKENGSPTATYYWNGTLSLKSGRKLTPKNCCNYELSVGFYVNATIDFEESTNDKGTITYRSCDDVPSDGVYLIDPYGTGDNESSFWTQCKNGFTEITQEIAKKNLNASLTAYGNVKDHGFIDGIRPFSRDGHGSHYSHYDIPIPFEYTEFYVDEFRIRAVGEGRSELVDFFYTQWESDIPDGPLYTNCRPVDGWWTCFGDFAMGSPTEEGPVTSYARFQSAKSTNGIHKFVGNKQLFHVRQSQTFRLLWGESGGHEGWAWWSGSIWVRNLPTRNAVYRKCELVPKDGVHSIDSFGHGPSTTFRARCVDGFMEITQAIAKDALNGTLSWEGDLIDAGFIDGRQPFTVGGSEGHYAHYDIPIPLGYSQFLLDSFNVRATSYLESGDPAEVEKGNIYTSWSQMIAENESPGGYGDISFGSPNEEGPRTSFGRYQSVRSLGDVHRFGGGDKVFDVTLSELFRLHWGEFGEVEGWAWWQGSIWVRDTSNNVPVYRSCNDVPQDGTYLIDPFDYTKGEEGLHLIDPFDQNRNTSFWTRCENGYTRITPSIAKNILNATLLWEGDVAKAGFIDHTLPYTVGVGKELKDHFAYYDIPIPFGYTEFYLEDFYIKSTGHMIGNPNKDISEIGMNDAPSPTYTRWNQKGLLTFNGSCCLGDFAFGSPTMEGPTTSYARFLSIASFNETHRFDGSGLIFYVPKSYVFRLYWGEGADGAAGWSWWSGSIWVKDASRKQRVASSSSSTTKIKSTSCSYNLLTKSCSSNTLSNGRRRSKGSRHHKVCNSSKGQNLRDGCLTLSQSHCLECEEGQAPNDERSECALCPPGRFSRRWFHKCQPCGQYEIQPRSGQTECKRLKTQIPSRTVL